MKYPTSELIGGAWLAAMNHVETVMPLSIISRIGGRRATQITQEVLTETYVESMRPESNLRGHLTFHLKHEIPHLELLSRLFQKVDPQSLAAWINAEPSGQYARRTGFLYEFLTGEELTVNTDMGGAYIDAIDDQRMVAASKGRAVPNRRWRVRDNMPGSPAFCPIIRKTADSLKAMAVDVTALIHELADEFGEALLMRSAVWMTLRESKSSFAIEGEADQSDRIQRFASVLSSRTGQGALPLDQTSLAELQSAILGQRTTLQKFGIRQSPVFVGEVLRFQETVHYVAPPAQDIQAMLAGLQTFLERTKGQSAVMRSAAAAFGFVYIHPLADGNGRVHRFLINDILRRDGAIKDPMILPVSSLISSNPAERRTYDRILDVISKPLMQSVTGFYEFSVKPTSYPDGITSNFVFNGDATARHAWRMMDLTSHVTYLADVLKRTISEDMREESTYLRSHAMARAAIKDIIEMPDMQIDRVIRSAEANQGELSRLLVKEMPALLEDGVWDAIRLALDNAFHPKPTKPQST